MILALPAPLSLLLSTALALAPERAAETPLAVKTESCPGLDADETGRLLRLELQTVTQEVREGPPLEVTLACEGDQIGITVEDPLTKKRLERAIPAPPASEPGRERVVALAVAQLFAASWLELLLVEPKDDAEGTPDESAIRAARRVAEDRVATVGVRSSNRVELAAAAGMRYRSLGQSGFPALHTDAEVRGWFSRAWGLVGQIEFEYGQTSRELGTVSGYAVLAGAGPAWRWQSRTIIGLGARLMVAGGYAHLTGRAAGSNVSGVSDGGTGEVSLAFGPQLVYRRFLMTLDVEAGGMVRVPEGLVQNDDPVSLGGFWVGTLLRIGVDLTRRQR